MSNRQFIEQTALKWWKQLSEQPGERAHLRRAATPLDVIQEPLALELVKRLPGEPVDRVAILAAVLAAVRADDERPLAGSAAANGLSNARFRRLLRTAAIDHETFMRRFRRLVRFMKGTASVTDLAFSILRWGDKTRRRWIFEYYGVPPSSTAATDQETASHA